MPRKNAEPLVNLRFNVSVPQMLEDVICFVFLRWYFADFAVKHADEDIEDDPAEVQRAWEDEIRRRLADVDAGTAELIPAEQVFSELRARFRK